jgi:hypothetical protein
MKRVVLTVGFLLVFTSFAFGAEPDLQNLGNDLDTLLEEIGKDTFPYLQQNALIGNGVGSAEMDEGVFFFGFGLGTVFAPGILTFLDDGNSDFVLLDVPGLVDTALENAGSEVKDVLDFFQKHAFYPQSRLSLGVHLPWDLEVIAHFSIFPQFITNAMSEQIDVAGFNELVLNRINAGGRVRKVLLSDEGGFPAVSLGAGYTYSGFHLSYPLPTFSQSFGSDFELSLEGTIDIQTRVHTAGLDLTVSKELLIFFPFLKISPYYQWSQFDGKIDSFDARFTNEDGKVIASTKKQDISPQALLTTSDLSLLLEAGVEIKIGKFYLVPYASFSVPTRTFAAALTMRLQF